MSEESLAFAPIVSACGCDGIGAVGADSTSLGTGKDQRPLTIAGEADGATGDEPGETVANGIFALGDRGGKGGEAGSAGTRVNGIFDQSAKPLQEDLGCQPGGGTSHKR